MHTHTPARTTINKRSHKGGNRAASREATWVHDREGCRPNWRSTKASHVPPYSLCCNQCKTMIRGANDEPKYGLIWCAICLHTLCQDCQRVSSFYPFHPKEHMNKTDTYEPAYICTECISETVDFCARNKKTFRRNKLVTRRLRIDCNYAANHRDYLARRGAATRDDSNSTPSTPRMPATPQFSPCDPPPLV